LNLNDSLDFSEGFFSNGTDKETLATRNTLLTEQLEAARQEKNNLLLFLKNQMTEYLGIAVAYWIQGSFKNHTVIRPVRSTDEFDVDVGLYILADAEAQGIEALYAKKMLNKSLLLYCESNGSVKLEVSKPNCERISFPNNFHIDLPLYYMDKEAEQCRLATQNDGWIDSDPKALQSWFDNQIKHLSDHEKARLRRVIKALKTWVSLKKLKLPSIAISTFLARNYGSYTSEENAIWELSNRLTNHILTGMKILSPINGDDLIGGQDKEMDKLKRACSQFQSVLKAVALSESIITSHQLWSIEFEHMLPALNLFKASGNIENLPTMSTPPQLSVKISSEVPAQNVNNVSVYRGDKISFVVHNKSDYLTGSEVIWIVRNTDKDAELKNDLGHIQRFDISESVTENCEYRGKHVMECTVLNKGQIIGVSAVEVNISNQQRPVRNPPKKRYGPVR
jgi:hypothetical protein